MIKNAVISGLIVKILFDVSPYTFGPVDAVVSAICGFSMVLIFICDMENTWKSRRKRRRRKEFRRLINITNLGKEEHIG